MRYWAHSDPDGLAESAPGARWQTLEEHLRNVAAIARTLAQLAAPASSHFHDLAEWAGLLHDLGKYSNCFQQMIRSGTGRCQHAIHGAVLAYCASGLRAPHIAHAVAGHHAGIPDRIGGLQEKIKKFESEALALREIAMQDSPPLGQLLGAPPPKLEPVSAAQFDLLTRMLFSCLVDADRLDTAGRAVVQTPLEAPRKLERLLDHVRRLSAKRELDPVNHVRQEVLEDCLAAAEIPDPLRSLSVPTGGGKTLAAMAYALKRATLEPHRFRRIIVVIPFLSIIEQNAQIYVDLFGPNAVLEHHSGILHLQESRQGGRHFIPAAEEERQYETPVRRNETENWDAPLIVTTSVRFFESLFSNHPSDLRRVHNIARSIVILDEVQVLPRHLLAPLLSVIKGLTADWGCTFVFSTATQPAFETDANAPDPRWPAGTLREIIRAPAELHRRLKRVQIDWRIRQPVSWSEVAQWMSQHRQALCVVNTRQHAGMLYDEVAALRGADGLFHLSTRMCAAHRLEVIARIRERLASGEPCLVTSTQLIEAGVDVDFPIAFRALGPLDSIIQTAGRVDREGRLTALSGSPGGRLVVFLPEDHRMPPHAYEEATAKTQAVAMQRDIQCDDLQAMRAFFERYYGENADLGEDLQRLRRECRFATLADEFEMISSRTQDIFVPFGEGQPLLEKLAAIGQMTKDLRGSLQRYTVGLPPWEFQTAKGTVLWEVRRDSGLWIASEAGYSPVKGLELALSADGLIS